MKHWFKPIKSNKLESLKKLNSNARNSNILSSGAFTIVEVSIVLTIMAIMIIGIASSKLMIRKARLANAQSLTQRSIIKDISPDLVTWYETSLSSSFLPNEIINDGSNISIWKDNNINANVKNNATNSSSSNQPKYSLNVFNDSIPGIRFDGTDDFLNFSCNKIANSPYTIFVVEQRRSNKDENYFIAGSFLGVNSNLVLGYRSTNVITQAHFGNDLDISIPSYTNPEPRIHTFRFNYASGKQYTLNGKTTTSSASQKTPLASCTQIALGRYASNRFYNGDLAEVIMFKRTLKTEEVEAIENYLGSKYGISVS